MGWIADLLKEIPSAARYKSELEAMEKENVLLKQQISNLEQKVFSLESGNEHLRQEKQRRDDVIQKEKSHDNLPNEQMEVLTLLSKKGLTEEKIILALNRGPEAIRFDLQELEEEKLIERECASIVTLWSLTQEGRRYLKKRGLLI